MHLSLFKILLHVVLLRGLQVEATCRLMTPMCCAAHLKQQRIGKLYSALFHCKLTMPGVPAERALLQPVP